MIASIYSHVHTQSINFYIEVFVSMRKSSTSKKKLTFFKIPKGFCQLLIHTLHVHDWQLLLQSLMYLNRCLVAFESTRYFLCISLRVVCTIRGICCTIYISKKGFLGVQSSNLIIISTWPALLLWNLFSLVLHNLPTISCSHTTDEMTSQRSCSDCRGRRKPSTCYWLVFSQYRLIKDKKEEVAGHKQ